MEIVPLTSENIEQATALTHAVFSDDAKVVDNPGKAFASSLTPATSQDFFKKYDLERLEYFVLVDE